MRLALRGSLLSLSLVLSLAGCGGGGDAAPAPTCTDGQRNGAETGVDCGGSTCPSCGTGGGCAGAADCTSGVCSSGTCAAPTCTDGVKNAAETAADCGGGTCPACAAGLACVLATDCQSGACGQGVCRAPGCADGVKNGPETAVDCGGTCPPCGDGLACVAADDCRSGVCASGACAAPTCLDGVKNGGEAGVDCGGPDCVPCADGKACAGGTDCASGACLSGLCRPATCADAVEDGDETDVDCGGSCPACASGLGCSAGDDCLSGACAAHVCLKSRGEACGGGSECGSSLCVDGVCCESPCSGTCEACNLQGRTGHCDPVPAGTDPADECPTDAASTCQRTGLCSGARSCALHAAGTVCAAASCAGATLVNLPDSCNGSGVCVDAGTQSCFPYACDGATGTCRTSCAADPDCAGGHACVGGQCKKVQGMTCGGDAECAGGFCTDGVCCGSRCAGTCERCNQAGRVGLCDPVVAGTDPDDECPTQAAATCGTTGLCSGARSCALHTAGTVCAAATCSADLLTSSRPDGCDGAGSCVDAGVQACAPYLCNVATGACRTSCTASGDCGTGYACSGGLCKVQVGGACTVGSQCASGACCSGVCRDLSSDASHCGSCGTACQINPGTASNVCVSGQCTPTCTTLHGNCDGNRVNGCETPLTSLANCGACGVGCSLPNATESCSTGTCTLVSCNAGFANCDGSPGTGCERQLAVYGNACPGSEYLGATPGDSACGFLCPASSFRAVASRTGFTSRWFRVTVQEASACLADLHARITLSVPASLDYDLYLYSACGTLLASSVNGTGVTEQLVVTNADGAGGDDTFDVWIEVRYFTGTACGSWMLTVEGTDC
jgi:hypothetical protein